MRFFFLARGIKFMKIHRPLLAPYGVYPKMYMLAENNYKKLFNINWQLQNQLQTCSIYKYIKVTFIKLTSNLEMDTNMTTCSCHVFCFILFWIFSFDTFFHLRWSIVLLENKMLLKLLSQWHRLAKAGTGWTPHIMKTCIILQTLLYIIIFLIFHL